LFFSAEIGHFLEGRGDFPINVENIKYIQHLAPDFIAAFLDAFSDNFHLNSQVAPSELFSLLAR